MSLSALSPFGPIFHKELRVAARRKRNYVLRVAYLLGLLLTLLLAWAVTHDSFGRGAAGRVQQQAQLGWMFFIFFSCFCVGAMGLIGPVLTSTAIGSERLARSLHVLLLTPITAWQIVAGKLLSRLLMALTLIGLSLPVLALVRLLGGVELGQMFGVVCLCAVTALATAALGLLLSVFMNRAFAVILLSYALMGLVYAFIPFFMAVMLFSGPNGRRAMAPWFEAFAASNPFFTTGMLASGQLRTPSLFGAGGWFVPAWMPAWLPCVIVHLLATAVLLVLSAILLRRVARREGGGAEATAPAPAPSPGTPGEGWGEGDSRRRESLDVPNTPSPYPLPEYRERGKTRRSARVVSDRPVLWRETHRPLMPARWQRIAGTLACFGLLVVTYLVLGDAGALDDEEAQFGYAFVFNGLAMLLACVLSATAIVQEKEADSWTLLLATPLSGEAIVWGKAIGQLRRLLAPLMLVVFHFAAFTVAGIISPTAMLLILWVIVTFNLPWVATGVALSLRFSKVTLAVILNLMIPVVLYGVVPLLLVVLTEFLDIDHYGDEVVEQVCWYLPYYYLGPGLEDLFDGWGSRKTWIPSGDQVSTTVFLGIAFVAGIVHVVIAAAIVAFTASRFDRVVGRAEQLIPPPYRESPHGFGGDTRTVA